MLPQEIEKLRQQYTDQYVVVDASQPEWVRFKDVVGQVKTVNFNGRALVQFDADSNRAWYDVDLGLLTIVDKPAPKVVEKKPVAAKPKPAAEKAAEPAAEKPATPPEKPA